MRIACVVSSLAAALLLPAAGRGDDFKEFKSAAGKFKVLMPGKPIEVKQKTPFGTLTMYCWQKGDNGYFAGYADLPIEAGEPEATTQKRLDNLVQGDKKAFGKVLSESKICLDKKYPGREYVFEDPDGQMWTGARFYLVGKRMYQLMVIGGTKNDITTADAKKFLDSLILVK